MPRPIDADSARTFDTIIASALTLVAEASSPMELSLRGVAERAGLSLVSVQYYFPRKEDLLESCLDGYYERLAVLAQAQIAAWRECSVQGDAMIEETVRAFYRFASRERALIRVRLVLNILRGELSPRRQSEFFGAVLHEAAVVMAPHVTIDGADARIAIQMLTTMIVRMALASDSEIRLIVGETGEAASVAIEAHLARAATRLLRPAAR